MKILGLLVLKILFSSDLWDIMTCHTRLTTWHPVVLRCTWNLNLPGCDVTDEVIAGIDVAFVADGPVVGGAVVGGKAAMY